MLIRKKPILDLKASKWLHHYIFCEADEFDSLFTTQEVFFVLAGRLLSKQEEGIFIFEKWKSVYREALLQWKSGIKPVMPTFFLTKNLEDLRFLQTANEKIMVHQKRPVIQIRPLFCLINEKEIQYQIASSVSQFYGLDFSYPTLYVEPSGGKIVEVFKENQEPNSQLFRNLQRWMRHTTTPYFFSQKASQIRVSSCMQEILEQV